MKKYIFIALGAVLIAGLAWAGVFGWQNLRGIGPAFKSPSEDITKVENTKENLGLQLPDGFRISIFAQGLGKPRVMEYDPLGNLLVSIPSRGKVVALPDRNNDGIADETITVIGGLNRPHGLATRCGKESCEFYIAESDQVAVYAYDQQNLKATNKRKIVDLPDGGNHFTRTILFMPPPQSGRMLISVGSSCNVCNEKDWRRAKILSVYPDGSDFRVFASGLRNAVFMTIHPESQEIFATEMGRDLLGDDLPPDEINIVEEGADYGWPNCYGKNVLDAKFHKDDHVHIRPDCSEPFETPSYIDISAHSSPLGLAFIPKEGWPQEYWYDLLVAYHGSWNRSEPTGYKIVRYKLDKNGTYLGEEDFITGWLTESGGALGRPVDIMIQPDGVMYITDDKAGVVYKVAYEKEK